MTHPIHQDDKQGQAFCCNQHQILKNNFVAGRNEPQIKTFGLYSDAHQSLIQNEESAEVESSGPYNALNQSMSSAHGDVIED